jgi:RNA polymerase sigma-70 factor (ECF subfamily)
MYDIAKIAMTTELASSLRAAALPAYESAKKAWPGIAISVEEFALHLASVLPRDAAAIPAGLHTDDLFLACGCAKGDRHALELFSSRVLSIIPASVSRISTSPAFVDELTQHMRELLLVGRSESRPRIGEYRGTGPLVAWVRISATRAAIRMMKREERTSVIQEEELRAMESPLGTELEYLRVRYRPIIGEALREALGGLAKRDRDVLRDHFVRGLTIDELGERHGVHRATAARWIAAARERLFVATRSAAARRLHSADAEVDSVMQLVASQLELSMRDLDDS